MIFLIFLKGILSFLDFLDFLEMGRGDDHGWCTHILSFTETSGNASTHFTLKVFMFDNYYLTRAVSSPMSDLGKEVLPAWLPYYFVHVPACLAAVLLCPRLQRGSRQLKTCVIPTADCNKSPRITMPIRITSQIAVDWKSVHFVMQ